MSDISKKDIEEIMKESFWETEKGQQLADVMLRSLPKLNYRERQCYFQVPTRDVSETIKEKIENGLCYVDMVEAGTNETLLIFSKLTPIRELNNK